MQFLGRVHHSRGNKGYLLIDYLIYLLVAFRDVQISLKMKDPSKHGGPAPDTPVQS